MDMEELDLLKKDWQKNAAFEQVSEVEIYKMLHMKSSSIVKWILIVSLLEFAILNGIAFFTNDKSYEEFMRSNPFMGILEKFNYLVILVFIYFFYRNYKTISVLNSSKKLIEHILSTRRIVTYYIYWNIIIGGITGAMTALQGFKDGWNSVNPNVKEKSIVVFERDYILIILMALFIMGFLWLFYKILYGRFLSKLKDNYTELKKIDL